MTTSHLDDRGAAPDGPRRPVDAWIGGRWRQARDGRRLAVHDPATGKVLDEVACCGPADVDDAVRAAAAAFDAHRGDKPRARERFLHRLADVIEVHADHVARTMTADVGMPLALSRAQVQGAVDLYRDSAGWATKLYGEVAHPSVDGDWLAYVDRGPLGVVAAVVPWNAPFILTALKLAPALATGNAVVLKPSELAPLSVLLLGELLEEAGCPSGLVSIVPGGPEAGAALVAHPDVAKVTFTGSVDTARHIVRASADTLKRVTLELGGKSPNVICAGADLDRVIPEVAWGCFAFTGQLCVAGTRVLVERSIHDEVVERLAAATAALRVGDGLADGIQIGPLISAAQHQRVAGYVEGAIADGAVLAVRAELPEGLPGGWFFAPHVFTGVSPRSRLAQEEVFGPVMAVLPFDDLGEAVALANDTAFGLAAGIYTPDLDRALTFSRRVRAGVVWVNAYLASDPALPFGGVKLSGYGREKGSAVYEEFTERKSVMIRVGR